ncbi:MAG: glycosyltransferase family A protein [Phycisphaerales bacterium JB040]
MDTPVAMIVFNRPDHTRAVVDALLDAGPDRVYVIADGPRPGHPTDADRCDRVRETVERLGERSELVRVYSDANLGCRERVVSGLDGVFAREERCVILEDDCVPHPSFFRFCAELLERYAADERVMSVSGDSLQNALGGMTFGADYFFTRYCHVWGWATWRRAWRHNAGILERWPRLKREGLLRERLDTLHERVFWTDWLDRCADGRLNTWDVPWTLAMWEAGGLSISPSKNLVRNIGMDAQGTHHTEDSELGNLPANEMRFPLRHPGSVERHAEADRWADRHLYSGSPRDRYKRLYRGWKKRVRGRVRGLLGRARAPGRAG